MKKITITLSVLFLLIVSSVSAESIALPAPEEAFRSYAEIDSFDLVVPTVVEVTFTNRLYENNSFLVYEEDTDTYISSYFQSTYTQEEEQITASTVPIQRQSHYLVDRDFDTSIDFEVPERGNGTVSIMLSSVQPVTASQIYLSLDQYVALPLTVAVKATTQMGVKTVVATKSMRSNTLTFPETTADTWEITFTYAQPLRIAELTLVQENIKSDVSQTLRFLAQPEMMYGIYFNADRPVRVKTTEGGDLYSDTGVLKLGFAEIAASPWYIPADVDKDGVRDVFDNCVRTANLDQEDIDSNGRGDACDDFDRDGRINSDDNCQNQPNRRQEDEDGDGIGDVCDEEESRLTERYIWIPWVGIGVAGAVLAVLFTLVAINTRKEDEVVEEESETVEN
ncbi:MAG: hypothetical protein ACI92I_000338 [Acidimicrobiales bacterium]|jgi:hypothetical protein